VLARTAFSSLAANAGDSSSSRARWKIPNSSQQKDKSIFSNLTT
jgi:hypothetical protein